MYGNVQHLSTGNVTTWFQQDDVEMIVGDALEPDVEAPVVVGFARYRKGAVNRITLPYDEVLVVTRGVFTVRRDDGVATAKAGEAIFHRAGAMVTYQADEDADLVYVSHPALSLGPSAQLHAAADALVAQLTTATNQRREHDRLAGGGPTEDNVALMRQVWTPFEDGQTDYQPFYDLLDDDVRFATPVGDLLGKSAVVHYFEHAWELIEARPFEKPLRYFGNGDSVAVLGEEYLRDKRTGADSRGLWVWLHEMRDGRIVLLTVFQDLTAVAGAVVEIMARTRAAIADMTNR